MLVLDLNITLDLYLEGMQNEIRAAVQRKRKGMSFGEPLPLSEFRAATYTGVEKHLKDLEAYSKDGSVKFVKV